LTGGGQNTDLGYAIGDTDFNEEVYTIINLTKLQ
jgi:hypothetical protein